MARFFLDENVPVRLARMLQDRDQEVLTVRGSLMRGNSDDALLVYAVEHDYIFVTRNKDDFVLLHGAWVRWSWRWGVSESHPGILITPHNQPIDDIADDIVDFVETIPESRFRNGLWEWEAHAWFGILPNDLL
jgi:hypothetical protein